MSSIIELSTTLLAAPAPIRNEPVQARSTARLAALLDSAAAVIDEIVHCDEDQIAEALKVLAWEENMLVEGAAALALAAWLADPEAFAGQTSAVLLCGSNYETSQLRDLL